MDRETILSKLPAFDGKKELINKDQSVGDIVNEVLDAHKVFADHYNTIALYFDGDSVKDICHSLFRFCKNNFEYDEQNEDNQLTMSPAAMLHLRKVDCKNYSGFCAGVLDALNRLTKRKINWCYRFASYRFWDRSPHHVFVVVNPGANEIWLDPTPGANNKNPVWQIDKKIKVSDMALSRVSGVTNQLGAATFPVNDLLNELPDGSPIFAAVQILLKYGIMNVDAKVNDRALAKLQSKVSESEYEKIVEARKLIGQAAIGNLWGDVVFAAKKAMFFQQRTAFLLLTRMNGFGFATKIKHAIFKDDTMTEYYQPGQDIFYKTWHGVGGDWDPLKKAVIAGAKNKAILGGTIGSPVTFPMAVAACATLIPIIGKVVTDILKQKQQQTGVNYNIDPTTGLPYGNPMLPQSSGYGGGIMAWIGQNPLIILAGAVAIYFFSSKKKTAA